MTAQHTSSSHVQSLWRMPEFTAGIHTLLQVAPGTAAWGLMTGVAMAQSGMDTTSAVLMSIFVFAGSAQLATLPLIAAGAPLLVIWLTAFCVNLRFVVFSLQLRPYMLHLPWWRRLLMGYLTADMSYVQFLSRFATPATNTQGQRQEQAFLLGSDSAFWVTWTTFSLLGLFLAGHIPTQWGLGFAGILSLLAILCTLVKSKLQAAATAVAGVFGIACYALSLKLNILAAIAAAVLICLLLEKAMPPSAALANEAHSNPSR